MNRQMKKDLKNKQTHTKDEYAKNKEILSESKVDEKIEQNKYITKINTEE